MIPAPSAYISDYEKYDIMSYLPRVSNIEMIFRSMWEWIQAISYWFTCLSCIISLTLYAATKDKKFGRYTVVVFILWVFLKGFDSVL